MTIVGREFPGMQVGSSCLPIWPRHPTMVAMQALTAQAATGNRLILGVGLSHQTMIEGPYGIPFERPVRYMREYLELLVPWLREGEAHCRGELLATDTAPRSGSKEPSRRRSWSRHWAARCSASPGASPREPCRGHLTVLHAIRRQSGASLNAWGRKRARTTRTETLSFGGCP